jgi:hypothetical protein
MAVGSSAPYSVETRFGLTGSHRDTLPVRPFRRFYRRFSRLVPKHQGRGESPCKHRPSSARLRSSRESVNTRLVPVADPVKAQDSERALDLVPARARQGLAPEAACQMLEVATCPHPRRSQQETAATTSMPATEKGLHSGLLGRCTELGCCVRRRRRGLGSLAATRSSPNLDSGGGVQERGSDRSVRSRQPSPNR